MPTSDEDTTEVPHGKLAFYKRKTQRMQSKKQNLPTTKRKETLHMKHVKNIDYNCLKISGMILLKIVFLPLI